MVLLSSSVRLEWSDDDTSAALLWVNQYKIIRQIGEGAYATVYLAQDTLRQNNNAALKVMSKEKLEKIQEFTIGLDGLPENINGLDRVATEITILMLIARQQDSKAQYITKLQEVMDEKGQDHLVLASEFYNNGQLMDWNADLGRYTFNNKLENQDTSGWQVPVQFAKKALRQLVQALLLLKQLGIAHRDIKPDNMLLDSDKSVKLIDFGVSKRFTDPEPCLATGISGTLPFVSPEACSGIEYDAFKADIWSLGVSAYAMVTGKVPFWSDNLADILDLITTQEIEFPDCLDQDLDFSMVLSRMLTRAPDQRISIEELDDITADWPLS